MCVCLCPHSVRCRHMQGGKWQHIALLMIAEHLLKAGKQHHTLFDLFRFLCGMHCFSKAPFKSLR